MALNYNDIICQAIDTIVSKRIESLGYDKTIKAIIVDDSEAASGHYVVNDGSIDFDAYSEDTGYVNDENVYVTVPNGDFTQTKIIISKYTDNNGIDPIAYSYPLDNIYIISDNLAAGGKLVNNSILANGRDTWGAGVTDHSRIPPGKYRLIWEQDLKDNDDYIVQSNAVFDTLAIKADFSCSLGSTYSIKKGNYGLIIEVNSEINKDTANSGQSTRFYLDTTDMIGNPYSFLSYVNQVKRFDISNLNTITNIKVYLYQGNNFTYVNSVNNQEVRVPTPLNGDEIDDSFNNIFVDNLEIYFGIDISKVNDNTFKIYTTSSSTYDVIKAQENPYYNQKIIVPIWFNKSENNNKYLGFSDGVYDFLDSTNEPIGKAYDEEDYLALAKYYDRGSTLPQMELAEKGVPSILGLLQAYADGLDIKQLLTSLATKFDVNIPGAINQLLIDLNPNQTSAQRQRSYICKNWILSIQNSPSDLEPSHIYEECLGYIVPQAQDEDTEGSFMSSLLAILQDYGKIYKGEATINTVSGNEATTLVSIIQQINEYVEEFRTTLNNDFFSRNSSHGIYYNTPDGVGIITDAWKESLNKTLDSCKEDVDKIMSIILMEDDSLLSLANPTVSQMNSASTADSITIQYNLWKTYYQLRTGKFYSYEEERSDFINGYSNRYCIYWYRYVGENVNVDNELGVDPFMPKGWERITNLNNQGIPDGYFEGDDGNLYFNVRPADPRVLVNVGDATLEQEQIQAICIFNHEIFKSNILTFFNDNPAVDDDTSTSATGLYISLTNQETNAQGEITVPDSYYSKETYQLYGITNNLISQKERMTRTLRARYKTLTKTDEYLRNDCIIYWFVPLYSTMLTFDREELINAGFSVYDPSYMRAESDLDADIQALDSSNMTETEFQAAVELLRQQLLETPYPLPPSPYGDEYRDGYAMFWKEIKSTRDPNDNREYLDITTTEFYYHIKDYYVQSATNNTIYCRVVKKNLYTFDAEQYFTFASYGTCGTDYTLSIVPASNQAVLTDNTPLWLKVQVRDTNGEVLETETANTKISWYANFGGAMVAGTAPDICVRKVGNAFNYCVLQAQTDITINSYSEAEIEDGVYQNGDATGTLDNEGQRKSRKVTLTAYYPIPYATEDYYLEGPTTVVYDSAGSNPVYYNYPYELFNGKTSENPDTPLTGVSVSRSIMQYAHGSSGNTTVPSTLVKEAIPKLKKIKSDDNKKISQTFNNYRIDLSIPSMYLITDYYSMAVFKDANGGVLFAQPILIIQNRYASTMLNEWDGELTIDKKNGTILASMIGAGRKESDNTFSGVLMGTVSDTSGDTAAGGKGTTGMYGYNHSEQAFGFKDDGTAFIGKTGRGRIEFNGNSGVIQSSSYRVDGTGMRIDMDDGEIDMRGGYIDDTSNPNNTPGWDPEDPETWDQNEAKGYDNIPKYSPTGSQVKISVNSPFFTIKSADKLYYNDTYDNVEDNKDLTVEEFWKGILYYKDKATLIQYLKDTFQIDDMTERKCLPAAAKIVSSDTDPTNILGTLPTTYPYYVQVVEPIPIDKVNNNFLNKFGVAFTAFKVTIEVEVEPGEDVEEGTTTKEEDIMCFFTIGDYVKVVSANFYQYISAVEAEELGISEMNPTTISKAIVGPKNKAITKLNSLYADNNEYKQYSISETSLSDLADSILSGLDIVNDVYPSLNALSSEANFYRNKLIRFLQPNDIATAEYLYLRFGIKTSKVLMQVATDNYYLQTDNYQADTTPPFKHGQGFKFDLMKGTIDAYNFNLKAADPITGSYITLSSGGNPFFSIKYSGDNRNQAIIDSDVETGRTTYIDLIQISKSAYQLNSYNWYDGQENSGMHLDLVNGKIKTYNFDLQAYASNGGTAGSFIKMNASGNPWIQVHYIHHEDDDPTGVVDRDLDILNIGRNQFLMNSMDWEPERTGDNPVVGKGMQINLRRGSITSYNFDLLAKNSNEDDRYFGSYLRMRSSGSPYWQIHYKDIEVYLQKSVSASDLQYVQENRNKLYPNITYYKQTTGTNGAITYSKIGSVGQELDLIPIGHIDWNELANVTGINFTTANWDTGINWAQIEVQIWPAAYPILIAMMQQLGGNNTRDFMFNGNCYYRTFTSSDYFYLASASTYDTNTQYYEIVDNGCRLIKSGVTAQNVTNYYIQINALNTIYFDGRAYYHINTHPDLDLINVTNTNFIIHSQSWVSGKSGMELDFRNGSFKSYTGFTLDVTDNKEGSNNQGSRIILSTNGSPYFRINHVDKGRDQSLIIAEISKSNYYFRSWNWKSGTSGLMLDLVNGKLTAYQDFTLFASGDNAEVRFSTINPYLYIKKRRYTVTVENGQTVIKDTVTGLTTTDITEAEANNPKNNITWPYVLLFSNVNQYITSLDWNDASDDNLKSGMKLDLKTGKFTAYKQFTLFAKQTTGQYAGSFVKISNIGSSTIPYIQVHYTKTDTNSNTVTNDLDILKIGYNTYLLQSGDWSSTNKTGVQLNLMAGTLTAYKSFTLYTESTTGRALFSSSSPFFQIGLDGATEYGSGDYNKWLIYVSSGDFYLRSKNYVGTGDSLAGALLDLKNGNFYSYSGTLKYGNAILSSNAFNVDGSSWSSVGQHWRFAIGTTFGVTDDGILYATGGHFSGTITGSSIYIPNESNPVFSVTTTGAVTASNITVTGGSINVGNFQMDVNGNIRATNAYLSGEIHSETGNIGGWDINQTTLTNANGTVTLNSDGTISGATISGGSININSGVFQVDSSGNLTATSATITGDVTANTLTAITNGTIGPYTIGTLNGNPVLYSDNIKLYGSKIIIDDVLTLGASTSGFGALEHTGPFFMTGRPLYLTSIGSDLYVHIANIDTGTIKGGTSSSPSWIYGYWKTETSLQNIDGAYYLTTNTGASINHNHDGTYAPAIHNHDGTYAPADVSGSVNYTRRALHFDANGFVKQGHTGGSTDFWVVNGLGNGTRVAATHVGDSY